jgi:uncharacterized protein (TIGR03083 family)
MDTATDTADIAPVTHAEAMDLQAKELERTVELLGSLTADEWTARTDCPDWDVHRMYLHVLGACEAGASMRENVHQLATARSRRKKEGGPLEAALSWVQVEDRAELTPDELVAQLTKIAPQAVRGRRRTPGLMRNHAKLKIDGPVHETWKLGYLIDTIYLRDMWMHRIDASRATGRPMVLTADHDGRIVADVVREWTSRHGHSFQLDLDGPAGGSFAHEPDAPDAERLSLDAVEFCRALAGRAEATGLLTTIVPF